MNARHTPGPWEFRPWAGSDDMIAKFQAAGVELTPNNTNEGQRIIMGMRNADGERRRVAVVDAVDPPYRRADMHECAERDANALLIAAAPKMLEMLQEIYAHLPDADHRLRVLALISEATGGGA